MNDDVYYFSNGTQGFAWMAENCDRCLHDHSMHGPDEVQDVSKACIHICSMLSRMADPVFIRVPLTITRKDGTTWETDDLECTEYTRCSCDRGPDDPGVPERPPVDPNQGALFDTTDLMPGVYRDVVLDTLTPATAEP